MLVGNKTPHSLFWSTLVSMKWLLLSAIAPRLALIAFNFCQPFLLQRAIELSQERVTVSSNNAGYGLIGAYFLVYLGIAVSGLQMKKPALADLIEDIDWTVSASHISCHHNASRWSDLFTL